MCLIWLLVLETTLVEEELAMLSPSSPVLEPVPVSLEWQSAGKSPQSPWVLASVLEYEILLLSA